MANFKEFLLRQKVTDDDMGDFIIDVKRWVENEWQRKPFHIHDKPIRFPSDWEYGWELYEKFLKDIGAGGIADEIGKEWWEKFVVECEVKPTKSLSQRSSD